MNIGVIGGGAIGLLLAAYLRKSGFNVTLYTRSQKQATQLEESGIKLRTREGSEMVSVVSRTMEDVCVLEEDLIFVTVKQFHLKKLFDSIDLSKHPQAMVFLQNGMGHLSVIRNLPVQSLFVGVVEHGAMRTSMTDVHHTGIGVIKIGAVRGEIQRWSNVWKVLSENDFPITVLNNWLTIMERKLIVNACINPLTALYRVTNGTLVSNPHFQKLMRSVYEETVASLEFRNDDGMWEEVLAICEKTANNRSSMLRDIENNNETEIDAITGYVLQKGEEKGIPIAITAFLYESIKGIEREAREKVE
ncbi:2-dehydropantoate 2-reductase [Alkalihalophilus pseudofirmus]|uniref:2-dehydropantoate 2-reductase n=1 Tax=Alkalihalobacterium alkalinitrilicum TaxID=427920 RepID=UPI00094CBB11|nr:2-dehydropantoate 2-reductase [Alkalihalobacterium alkalinitrilicum]OLO40786.1 2-dehydropantoate 2-reductase [Alkalihalophilus pseudofirmus]